MKEAGIGGWLKKRDMWSTWADLLVTGFGGSALRQVFCCGRRILLGGTHV